jgi:hypothetical protein
MGVAGIFDPNLVLMFISLLFGAPPVEELEGVVFVGVLVAPAALVILAVQSALCIASRDVLPRWSKILLRMPAGVALAAGLAVWAGLLVHYFFFF